MTTPKPLPPIEMLRSLFDHNPETGEIIWRVNRRGRGAKVGDRAGFMTREGYREVKTQKRCLRASRLMWALHYGEDPGLMQVDHINRVRDDDRICNLRLVTQLENLHNRDPLRVGRPRKCPDCFSL